MQTSQCLSQKCEHRNVSPRFMHMSLKTTHPITQVSRKIHIRGAGVVTIIRVWTRASTKYCLTIFRPGKGLRDALRHEDAFSWQMTQCFGCMRHHNARGFGGEIFSAEEKKWEQKKVFWEPKQRCCGCNFLGRGGVSVLMPYRGCWGLGVWCL
jgi:hypothetical protein